MEILTHTGPSTFEIDLSKNSIRKIDPEAQVDLSGIAKGYAVDAVAEALEQAGANAFLIEVGGEVRASGGRLDGSPWRVAIERPDAQGRSIQTTVVLNNAAIATSGDYRNYFEIGDRRYSHIIDPKTGRTIGQWRGFGIGSHCRCHDRGCTGYRSHGHGHGKSPGPGR